MQKFKVFAEFKNPADRKYNPEWEAEVSANLTGEAYEQGCRLFRLHCIRQKLDYELFQVHAGTP